MKQEYNEKRELRHYLICHYQDLMRVPEAMPSESYIYERIPDNLKEEYIKHGNQCKEIIDKTTKLEEETPGLEIFPALPEMSDELSTAFSKIRNEFEDMFMERILRENKDKIFIHRCSKCNKILATPKAQQCLWCGYDWHERKNV